MNERYAITLESVSGQTTPAATRLRALLKLMLRGYGLRVTEARELTETTADALDSTQTASKAKDDDSIGLATHRVIRNAKRVKRSGKKTENEFSGTDG